LNFENGRTTFLRNVKDQADNDRLLSLSLSDPEVALCSVRPKPVQTATAIGQLPVQRTVGADWQQLPSCGSELLTTTNLLSAPNLHFLAHRTDHRHVS